MKIIKPAIALVAILIMAGCAGMEAYDRSLAQEKAVLEKWDKVSER